MVRLSHLLVKWDFLKNDDSLPDLNKADYIVYGPYVSPTNKRRFVLTIHRETKQRQTVSYPKWLVECHVGKKLDRDKHTVDHINKNQDDNRLNNLRVLNRKEHSALDTRRVIFVDLVCSYCGADFKRSPRYLRYGNKRGSRGCFCSKSCARHHYNQSINGGKELDIQPAIDSKYYSKKNHKNKTAHDIFERLCIKYG